MSNNLTPPSFFLLPSGHRRLPTPSPAQSRQTHSSSNGSKAAVTPAQPKWKPRSQPSQTSRSLAALGGGRPQPEHAGEGSSGISAGGPSGGRGLSWMERTREVGERMKEDEDGEGRVSDGDGISLRSIARIDRCCC